MIKIYKISKTLCNEDWKLFIQDDAIKLFNRGVTSEQMFELYMINPHSSRKVFEKFREINRKMHEINLKTSVGFKTSNVLDLYIRLQNPDSFSILCSDNSSKMLIAGMPEEMLFKVYTLSHCLNNSQLYDNFVSEKSQKMLKTQLMSPEELLRTYQQNPTDYILPKFQDVFFTKLVTVLQNPLFDKRSALNEISKMTFNLLAPFCQDNNALEKLSKSVKSFARNTVKFAKKENIGHGLSITDELIKLFDDFIEWLGITSKNKDVTDMINGNIMENHKNEKNVNEVYDFTFSFMKKITQENQNARITR